MFDWDLGSVAWNMLNPPSQLWNARRNPETVDAREGAPLTQGQQLAAVLQRRPLRSHGLPPNMKGRRRPPIIQHFDRSFTLPVAFVSNLGAQLTWKRIEKENVHSLQHMTQPWPSVEPLQGTKKSKPEGSKKNEREHTSEVQMRLCVYVSLRQTVELALFEGHGFSWKHTSGSTVWCFFDKFWRCRRCMKRQRHGTTGRGQRPKKFTCGWSRDLSKLCEWVWDWFQS